MKISEDFKLAVGLAAMLLGLNFVIGTTFVGLVFLIRGH